MHHFQFTTESLESNFIINELSLIFSANRVNPVLLSAICQFFLDIFTGEEIKKSVEMNKYLNILLKNLLPLFPYMGGKKYAPLCEMGEMYQCNTFIKKEPVDRIHLTNKVIHNFFISAVKLICYFSECAMNSGPLNVIFFN